MFSFLLNHSYIILHFAIISFSLHNYRKTHDHLTQRNCRNNNSEEEDGIIRCDEPLGGPKRFGTIPHFQKTNVGKEF